MTNMKIAVVGTGANGAGIGADLVRAGLDVTFVEQWPAHVEAMRANGLRVNLPDESQVTEVHAIHLCQVAELREKFDLVFVLVKAYDTRWACELIKPVVKDDGFVVGLQNGMTIDDMADVIGAERTLGAVIEVASNMFEPGIVQRQTPPSRSWFALGSIDGAIAPRIEAVADVLRHSGTVEVTRDIRSAKWMKLVVNAAELVPSALLDIPLADAVVIPGMREFMDECGREALHACVASGSRIVPIFGIALAELEALDDIDSYAAELLDAVLNRFCSPDTRTTVLQDWMKGRRAEGDDINGLAVRELERAGRSAPANALVVELARRVERGDLTPHRSVADLMVATGLGVR